MEKLKKVKHFCKFLDVYRINYKQHNEYHIQVQRIHNFYPSNSTYYNSDSDNKTILPEFKDGNEFLKFLADNTKISEDDKKEMTQRIKELQDKGIVHNIDLSDLYKEKNILEKANDIVFNRSEEKERQYGPFKNSMMKAASMASLLCGKEIMPADMYKCMIALKLSRISHKYSHDSVLDAIAYLAGLDDFQKMFDNEE